MDTEQKINSIEITLKQAKEYVNMNKSLMKLSKNSDFKKVILEGFFKNEASRVVLFKAAPGAADENTQKSIDSTIIAIGSLYQYFHTISKLAESAEKSIIDCEEAREDLLGEIN